MNRFRWFRQTNDKKWIWPFPFYHWLFSLISIVIAFFLLFAFKFSIFSKWFAILILAVFVYRLIRSRNVRFSICTHTHISHTQFKSDVSFSVARFFLFLVGRVNSCLLPQRLLLLAKKELITNIQAENKTGKKHNEITWSEIDGAFSFDESICDPILFSFADLHRRSTDFVVISMVVGIVATTFLHYKQQMYHIISILHS